jgi:N-acetylglucosaminyldiphosphoundecaprenol N-acetyl-beta-D-mannosaminyltransferase
MREQPWLQSYVDGALMVVADGQPIVWCASLFGGKLPERVAGIDLLEALCARAEAEGVGVYFLGGTPSVIHGAASEMRRRHPKLHIDASDGYFAANSARSRIQQIQSSRAGLLFVGMGTPLQEKFIEAYFDQSGTGIAIGVGGSFDVIAGLRFRAPRWTARFGLEWLVRLVQEPRRLLWRYVRSNSVFCLLLVRTIASRLKPH